MHLDTLLNNYNYLLNHTRITNIPILNVFKTIYKF